MARGTGLGGAFSGFGSLATIGAGFGAKEYAWPSGRTISSPSTIRRVVSELSPRAHGPPRRGRPPARGDAGRRTARATIRAKRADDFRMDRSGRARREVRRTRAIAG